MAHVELVAVLFDYHSPADMVELALLPGLGVAVGGERHGSGGQQQFRQLMPTGSDRPKRNLGMPEDSAVSAGQGIEAGQRIDGRWLRLNVRQDLQAGADFHPPVVQVRDYGRRPRFPVTLALPCRVFVSQGDDDQPTTTVRAVAAKGGEELGMNGGVIDSGRDDQNRRVCYVVGLAMAACVPDLAAFWTAGGRTATACADGRGCASVGALVSQSRLWRPDHVDHVGFVAVVTLAPAG